MQFVLPAIITAALALSAVAVDIDLFPQDLSPSCGQSSGFLSCTGVANNSCCNFSGSNVYAAQCTGLGSQDFCVIGASSETGGSFCANICNVSFGAGTLCVAPKPKCTTPAKGAFWVIGTSTQLRSEAVELKCERTVEPDRAVFANGQSFHINYGVPAEITALLIDLVRDDPHLTQGVPEAAASYEVKAAMAG